MNSDSNDKLTGFRGQMQARYRERMQARLDSEKKEIGVNLSGAEEVSFGDFSDNSLGISLLEAKNIITGERQDQYGNPEDSFATIAELWTTYLKSRKVDNGAPVTALDAANMMILFKMARCLGQSPKRDNYIDIQGYSAICADRLMRRKED